MILEFNIIFNYRSRQRRQVIRSQILVTWREHIAPQSAILIQLKNNNNSHTKINTSLRFVSTCHNFQCTVPFRIFHRRAYHLTVGAQLSQLRTPLWHLVTRRHAIFAFCILCGSFCRLIPTAVWHPVFYLARRESFPSFDERIK